jgi:hypothetical protein
MPKVFNHLTISENMEDEWWSTTDFDPSELCYGIPTDSRRIPVLARKILNSPYVDTSQGFSLELLLDVSQPDEELWDEELEEPENDISAVAEELRSRVEAILQETRRRFEFEGDLSEWAEGYGSIVEYTENRTKLLDCIRYLISQTDLFEYCTLGISFYLAPVSQLSNEPGFDMVCEEIEKRTEGEFSIRGKAELEPYDGIEAGSSFYQTFLLISPLYEFPLQFYRGHSEDNRLASPFYNYIFSRICSKIDCKLTLLRA